jgi:hypothetical protein
METAPAMITFDIYINSTREVAMGLTLQQCYGAIPQLICKSFLKGSLLGNEI